MSTAPAKTKYGFEGHKKIPVTGHVTIPGIGSVKIKASASKGKGYFKLHSDKSITYHAHASRPTAPVVVYANGVATKAMSTTRFARLVKQGVIE